MSTLGSAYSVRSKMLTKHLKDKAADKVGNRFLMGISYSNTLKPLGKREARIPEATLAQFKLNCFLVSKLISHCRFFWNSQMRYKI